MAERKPRAKTIKSNQSKKKVSDRWTSTEGMHFVDMSKVKLINQPTKKGK